MKSIKTFTLALAVCAAGFASLAGCKSNSTGPDGTDPLTKPGVGSTYTTATYETDSTGAKVPGSDSVTVTTVRATGLTIGGKSDVTFMTSDKSLSQNV
ncbi:MAG TPA: hypothetical protein VHI13_10490 [Candidatus Kapabacteria bacterium]|nr:hypothetical protein [Candidatus Kapabacteria bacterium]